MYPFERFTEDAKKALTLAQDEAERMGVPYIGTEHVLIGLTRADGSARTLLEGLGLDTRAARASVARVIGAMEHSSAPERIIPTSRVKTAIELAFVEARRLSSDVVGGEHLLLGILIEGEGIGAHLLQEAGVSIEAVHERLRVDAGTKATPSRSRHFSGYAASEPGTAREWHAVHAPPAVGARVLVHDPTPPYRMWEGTVIERGDADVTLGVPGHPDNERLVAPLDRIHSLPPQVMRCPYCEPEAWSIAVPAE